MKSLLSFLSYVALGLTCVAQVPSYVPNEGLVAWYDFDNDVADASENDHNGSVFGASFVESPLNGAVSFDGSDDYLEIPTSPVFEDMVHELTLSAWFKKTNSNTGTIVAKRNFVGNPCGERHHFELTCMPDNSVFFSASHNCIELNNTQVQSAPDVFQLNEWTHVAVTYDNGVLLMYVNGEVVLEHDEGYRELLPNNHWINFGRIHRSGGVSFFNEYAGDIDESGIWNRVLSAEEINLLLTGQVASSVPEYVPSEGLVAWWGMDGNGEDSHTGTFDATNLTATPATGRFGNENGALMFSGSDEMRGPGGGDMDAGLNNAITLSCWLNASQFAQNQGTAVFRHAVAGEHYNWAFHLSPLGDDSNSNHPYFLAGPSLFENNGGNISDFALQLDEWHHVVLRVVDGLVDMHVDGVEVFSNQTNSSFETTSNAEFVFGSTNNTPANDNFIGLMDDVGVWNRGISDAEILALFQVQSSIMGCTDETACNFNPEATVDDESCFEAPFIAAFGVDADSVSTCSGESITLSAMGTTSALDSTLLDSFTMTVNSYYSRTTPILESGHTYRLIGNGRYGFADGWSHNDPAWNYAWDQETGTKVYCNGTQDASEDVRWLYDGAANFQRPDNDYHNNDNNAFCNGSDKTYTWTIEGDGNAHVISWEDCCYGDNSGSLDFWIYELTGAPGGPETTWSTGEQGATTELTPSESQWVTLTTMLDGVSLCQDSIWIEVVTSGCNDENACNYSMLDVCSVDCVYPLVGEDCEAGAVACAEGTVWDAESQTCVVAIPAYLNEPGEAAILNPCYFDSNGNGLVEVTDLMNVLSVYGLACGEIPEAAEFTCGNPLSYQGYDYETVQIGEQCWLAENLRAEQYLNGEQIVQSLSNNDWQEISSGAVHFQPSIFNTTEALYNWHVINDARGLCPTGWHVSAPNDWESLIAFAGESNAAKKLKSVDGWFELSGTDDFGFQGLPVGYRSHADGQFKGEQYNGFFWTPSEVDSHPQFFLLDSAFDNVLSDFSDKNAGFSVRCIIDTE